MSPVRYHTSFIQPPNQPTYPLRWVGWGEEIRASPSYRWHGLRRGQSGCVLWQMTIAGEGRLRIGDEPVMTLRAGEGFLVRIPGDHCYYYQKGTEPWHLVWAMWAGPGLSAIWDILNKTAVRRLNMNPDSVEMRSFRHILHTREEEAVHTPADAVEAYRFLLHVCDIADRPVSITGRQSGATSSASLSDLLPQAADALREDPGAAIGKDDGLARKMQLSRFQLYRAIRRESGMSPKEWRAQQRMSEACRLLKSGTTSVADIAVKIGMPDANYFARFFRKRTGLTPRDWRKLFASNSDS
ncbi:MAG TPA: AraC family transcriptional regulator [Candidatus Methylacidiphilales bacterium]|nr:AraC family transcriptional regulator [Candidatus Methylacidiphilales bacterium]